MAGGEPGLSPALASCIADAAASAERLIGMVGELLDMSRLESGSLTTVLREADFVALAHGVADEVAPLVAKKRH